MNIFSREEIPTKGCLLDVEQVVGKKCAWCLSEQGIVAGEGSHGICKRHANALLLQQREMRRRIAVKGV